MTAYIVSLLTIVGFYVLLALALNLQWGITGLLNFGIAGFFALGAYASGLATDTLGWSYPLALCCALAVGALSGLGVALLSVRLSGNYLAIVTLGFAELVRLVLQNEDWLTGGPRGYPIDARPIGLGWDRETAAWLYLAVVAIACVIAFALVERLRRSPFGRTLRAIREDAVVAAATGKHVLRFRLQAFALGALLMAGAGSLYAHWVQSITPDHFTLPVGMLVWMAVIVGGAGNNWGVALGALLVLAIFEGTRFLTGVFAWLDAESLSALRIVLIGVLLILALRLRPQGLLPESPPHPRL